jgi:hypothetical protein
MRNGKGPLRITEGSLRTGAAPLASEKKGGPIAAGVGSPSIPPLNAPPLLEGKGRPALGAKTHTSPAHSADLQSQH